MTPAKQRILNVLEAHQGLLVSKVSELANVEVSNCNKHLREFKTAKLIHSLPDPNRKNWKRWYFGAKP